MERQVRDRPAVPEVFEARAGPDPAVSPAQVLLSEPEEAAALYRGLSRQPALSAACLGPEVTTQYGGRYRTVHTGVCMKGNRGEGGTWRARCLTMHTGVWRKAVLGKWVWKGASPRGPVHTGIWGGGGATWSIMSWCPWVQSVGLVRVTPIVLSHTHPQGSWVDARSSNGFSPEMLSA